MIDYTAKSFGPEFGYTNAYVIRPTAGREAVIVDPGHSSAPWIHRTLIDRGLTAAAVLLTHGHMDHTWDAAPLADSLGIPVYLASAGHHLLARPEEGLPTQFPLKLLEGHPHRTPRQLRAPDPDMEIAGLQIKTVPTPGHTPCSVVYVLDAGSMRVACTGDTVLGGARVGTPVPPKGDAAQLHTSARALFERWISGECTVLPGHGNPFHISEP